MLSATIRSTSSGWIRVAPVECARLLVVAARPAGEIGISLVDEVAHPVEPRHPHHRRRRIGDPPEPRLAFLQGALGDALLGHVLEQDDDPRTSPVGSAQGTKSHWTATGPRSG